jgi:hypothetical protein
MCTISINTKYLCPLPSHINLRRPEHLQEYVQSLPVAAYLIVFMAHYGQCIMASYIAIHGLKCTYRRTVIYTITLLTMMGSIANNRTIQNVLPIWVWIEIPLYFVILYYIDRTWITGKKNDPTTTVKQHSD